MNAVIRDVSGWQPLLLSRCELLHPEVFELGRLCLSHRRQTPEILHFMQPCLPMHRKRQKASQSPIINQGGNAPLCTTRPLQM